MAASNTANNETDVKVIEVPLPCGRVTLVDEDVWLQKNLFLYSWTSCAHKDGRVYAYAHRFGEKTKRKLKLHRAIMTPPDGVYVDHINGNGLDNRRANLRLCNNAQNQANTAGRGGSSKYKGVSWFARDKNWRVAFRANGEFVWVGYFEDEIEAAKAYNREARARLGEFARLNEIPCTAA